MIIRLINTPLSGALAARPSKSDAHRRLICAAVADRDTVLPIQSLCDDTEATISCLNKLGAHISAENGRVFVSPIKELVTESTLDCRESGSTLRFILPLAAALGSESSFCGSGRLPERPLGALTDVMKTHGISFSSEKLPFHIKGKLSPGVYNIPGNVSSQYISGLLMALGCGAGGQIRLTTPLQSAAYVDMTMKAMEAFGVHSRADGRGFTVDAAQSYRSPGEAAIDADWSNAAFFLCAGAVGDSPVSVTGLDEASAQGDKAVLQILSGFGADISRSENTITVSRGERMRAMTIDVSEIPDLLPVLSVVAACCEGETRFINAARLRLKESDRLASAALMINSLGGKAVADKDSLTVSGTGLCGGTVESFSDHRIVMSAAVASCACKKSVNVNDAQAVTKSYPEFFDDFNSLGGKADVI